MGQEPGSMKLEKDLLSEGAGIRDSVLGLGAMISSELGMK